LEFNLTKLKIFSLYKICVIIKHLEFNPIRYLIFLDQAKAQNPIFICITFNFVKQQTIPLFYTFSYMNAELRVTLQVIHLTRCPWSRPQFLLGTSFSLFRGIKLIKNLAFVKILSLSGFREMMNENDQIH
jgi:hypothetical protein